jgi:hypothetical protein
MSVENEPLTPEAVVRLLIEAHPEASNMEDLRPYLPASFRTLQRWRKNGWPKSAADAIQLLEDAGLLAPTGEARAPVVPPSPLDARLAEFERLMQAGRDLQEKQWEDIRQLSDAVGVLSRALKAHDDFVRSVLRPPDSGRGRRQRGA